MKFQIKNIFQTFSDKFDLVNKSLELLSFFLLIIVINKNAMVLLSSTNIKY